MPQHCESDRPVHAIVIASDSLDVRGSMADDDIPSCQKVLVHANS